MENEMRENDLAILNEIKEFKEEFIKHKATIETVLLGPDGKSGLCTKVQGHDEDINRLKNWQAKVIGAAAVVSFIVGMIFNFFAERTK